MFVRRTTIKSRESGEAYYTFRLVESVRTPEGVRQHTVLNLGRHFEVPRAQWGALAQRIEALLGGQLELMADGLDACWEALAEQYAARIVSRRGETTAETGAALARVLRGKISTGHGPKRNQFSPSKLDATREIGR